MKANRLRGAEVCIEIGIGAIKKGQPRAAPSSAITRREYGLNDDTKNEETLTGVDDQGSVLRLHCQRTYER